MSTNHGLPPLAALIHPDDRHDIEALMESVARRLQQSGRRVGGLVHRQSLYANGNKCMRLVDLRSGRQFEMTEDLGASSKACSLNPQALAQASVVLRQALADGVELAMVNCFGQLEAAGGGFVQEIAGFVEAGIPVITAVAARHEAGWLAFTGGDFVRLPVDEEALLQWCGQQLERTDARGLPC
ncbi:DUF2478 domain-containing protein [Comamonas resistens]|uniref:DUF2478 domain-containing protein n=1 Tax=Comamonas resistens TaxID=3046670 RepID=A0ABY8ST74_9BURK|nr:DUF2478 domain-containing protein [Comamonas resistens]MDL5036075.1 DUF2478 domain-containing protein [Comamonas resistens]WHS66173.1 DUF2478 domain-containing protein [Comamonas resistens]